jgi:hypothetical protein
LKGTKTQGLILKPTDALSVDCYADADFAGLYSTEDIHDPVSVKSRTGYVITLVGRHMKHWLFQPFHEVAVDLIGPWAIQVGNESYSISALTILDKVTTMAELIRIDNKMLQQAMMKFENEWLSRYPCPVCCIYDQGPEFMGAAFQTMLNRWSIEAHPISVQNPQANAVCERMHQTVGNLPRTLLYTANPSHNLQQANDLVDTALATASHALRSTVHSTMGLLPGSIVSHRDMFLDIPFVTDLMMLREKCQAMIDYNLC